MKQKFLLLLGFITILALIAPYRIVYSEVYKNPESYTQLSTVDKNTPSPGYTTGQISQSERDGCVIDFNFEDHLRNPNDNNLERTGSYSELSPLGLGNGVISITVDSSMPSEYHQYIYDLFQVIYPYAVQLYGPPAFSRTITVIKSGGPTYGSNKIEAGYGSDKIYISSPNITLPYHPSNPNDPRFDYVFIHELLHGFHDPIFLVLDAGYWAEEGMAEAGTQLIALYLQKYNIRNIIDTLRASPQEGLLEYDSIDQWGTDILKGFVSVMDVLSYQQASALFWMLMGAATDADSGSWSDYDFLKRMNARLMDDPYPTLNEFVSMIDKEAPYEIDGLTAGSWFRRQPLVGSYASNGTFLGISASPPVSNPSSYLHILARAAKRTLGYYERSLSGNIEWKITNLSGTTKYSSSMDISEGWGISDVYTDSWEPGGYKIEAWGTIDGKQVYAKNFLLIYSSPLQNAVDGLGLVVTSSTGELLQKQFESLDGIFPLNSNAGAVLKPFDVSHLPKNVTLETQPFPPIKINLPLPYTRLIATNLNPIYDYIQFLPLVIGPPEIFEWPNPSPGNLAPNPSFEIGSSQPDGWLGYMGGATYKWDDTQAISGIHSLSLSNFQADRSVEWITDNLIPINPGHVYKISIWVKGTGYTVEPYVSIYTYDQNGKWLLMGQGSFLSYSSNEWTRQTFSISIDDPRAAYAMITIGTNSIWSDTGTIWFDDIYFGYEE
jgi:hypothetical protein